MLAFTSQNFSQTLMDEQMMAIEILENHVSDSKETVVIKNKLSSDGESIKLKD